MKKELLDHGYLELVEAWGSDEDIIRAARQSTQKGFLGWGVEETCATCDGSGTGEKALGHGPGSLCPACRGKKMHINKPGDEKLLRRLWTSKETGPFEFAGATIEVKMPIFNFRQWHRHRTQSYSEASGRYAPLPDDNYVPSVERMLRLSKTNRQAGAMTGAAELNADSARAARATMQNVYDYIETAYQELLHRGVPKELARVVLPVGRYSVMRATANLWNWTRFLTLRMDEHAQEEIRVYANALHDMLAEKFPRTMTLFDESRAR